MIKRELSKSLIRLAKYSLLGILSSWWLVHLSIGIWSILHWLHFRETGVETWLDLLRLAQGQFLAACLALGVAIIFWSIRIAAHIDSKQDISKREEAKR